MPCLSVSSTSSKASVPQLHNMQKERGVVLLWALLIAGSVDAQEFDCPPGVDGAYPHPEFCWMYYDCFNDIATLLECQLDYLFSDVNFWCDFPDVVDCGDRLPRPTGSTPSGGTDQTTPVDSSTTTIGSSTTGGGGFQCPTANGYYPHDVFCYMYYECVNFLAYPHECPGDQLFHRDLTACRPPPEVDCGNLLPRPTTPSETTTTSTSTSTTTTIGTTGSGEFQCPEPDGFFPDPESCDHFYQCDGGDPLYQECPEGTWFNPNIDSCDFPGDFCTPLKIHPVPK